MCSSLGKGVATASIGALLEASGLRIAIMKCDPYINVDAGTISPYQRGEVYVTEDGAEADMDLGNYSRFTSVNLTSDDCLTIGKVYEEVIKNERAGRYNGRTVQVIPHITDEIKRRIRQAGSNHNADIVIVEIGGTVGDIESIPYLEAARQLFHELGHERCISIHLTLVPVITGGELKSKPTQHAVKQLQEAGIQPDILLCRTATKLDESMKKKIALFCNVSPNCVFTSTDVTKSIYEIPLLFHNQGLDKAILDKLCFNLVKCNMKSWVTFLTKLSNPTVKVCIAMVGNKDYLEESYKSVRESLFHAAVTGFDAELEIRKIDAEALENCEDVSTMFEKVQGIVIPGSYGQRGFLGLLEAVRFARKTGIAFLGIDIGMQLMAIEAARNILGWKDADSTEFVQNTQHPIISLPEDQTGNISSVMKLGNLGVELKKNSKLYKIYNNVQFIEERHRNKYIFDKRFESDMQKAGLVVSAYSATDKVPEAIEWTEHRWGIGVQYHPEFVSRPSVPHPLFTEFIRAALHR